MKIEIEDTDCMMVLFALRNCCDDCIEQEKANYEKILINLEKQLADQLTVEELECLLTLMNYKFILY